ncbi:peptidase S24/S26A/S26B/S26C [Dipodascopsis uninucleata]
MSGAQPLFHRLKASRPNLYFTGKTILVALSWVPAMVYVANHVVWIGVIDGSSMSPTLNPESNGLIRDVAFLWKVNAKNYDSYTRGTVVVLRNPRDPTSSVVKRIVAFEGETVRTRFPYPESTCVIPKKHFWVEGDNIHSVDSNTYGPVSHALVTAKVTRIIFPFSRLGMVPLFGGRDPRSVVVNPNR